MFKDEEIKIEFQSMKSLLLIHLSTVDTRFFFATVYLSLDSTLNKLP